MLLQLWDIGVKMSYIFQTWSNLSGVLIPIEFQAILCCDVTFYTGLEVAGDCLQTINNRRSLSMCNVHGPVRYKQASSCQTWFGSTAQVNPHPG